MLTIEDFYRASITPPEIRLEGVVYEALHSLNIHLKK